jgi:SAM-dependent methyltransferase
METTQGTDEIRGRMHAMWAGVAEAWGEHADHVDDSAEPVTDRLVALARPAPGERVLELACGAGGLGLAVARRCPECEVVQSDVVPRMTELAAARKAAAGVDNVTTRVLDLEEIAEPDESYDAVVCREGLMFAADHARALREIRRVLRPGGRLAVAVWGPRARNPWLGILLDAVGEQIGSPVPPPGVPGPFALEDGERLASLLADAGLAEADVTELASTARLASFDEWWTRTTALAGLLAALPAEARDAIRARTREGLRPYEVDGALELPRLTLIGFGARA